MQQDPHLAAILSFIDVKVEEWRNGYEHPVFFIEQSGKEKLAQEFAHDIRFAESGICIWLNNPDNQLTLKMLDTATGVVLPEWTLAMSTIQDAILLACGIREHNANMRLAGLMGLTVLAELFIFGLSNKE